MTSLGFNFILKHLRYNFNNLNRIGCRFATSSPCDPEKPKPVCPKKSKDDDEVPCDKMVRGEDCDLIPPSKHKNKPCPKTPESVEDCAVTAVATTKETKGKEVQEVKDKDKDKEKDKEKKEEETQVVLAEPLKKKESLDDDCYDPKIVIIGAGLSGLTAANRLTTMGFHNITLLEATNRPGGRIHSVYFGDTIVNLGGVWNEDEDESCADNPIMYHAERNGMVRSQNNLNMAKGMMKESSGTSLPMAPGFIAVTKMRRILAVADSLRTTSPYQDQGRLDQYIGLRMQQELRNVPDESKAIVARVFSALTMLVTGKNYLETDGFGPHIAIPGSNIKIPLGSSSELTPLLKNVNQYIRYCKEVSNISWGALGGLSGQRSLIRTTDGSEYSADFVLYTASLGSLKENHSTLFCPTLPCPYVNSIEDIQYEHVTRIFFYYKTPLKFMRQTRIEWKIKEEDVKDLKGSLAGLREIKELTDSERVLSFKLVGRGALKSETQSEKVIVDELITYIRKKSGDCIQMPDDVLRTKWTSNKYYRGARAIKGLKPVPLPSCGSPNPPVIFFAGDGTAEVNPGSVIGAYISGLREADKILSYLPGSRNEMQATDACLQLQASLAI